MRRDMKEVLVETGRRWKGCKKGWSRLFREPDDEPAHTSMRPKGMYDYFEQGDKLNPLVRFLESRVGRRWDDVYSEICRVNDKRSMLGFHLLTHLSQYVSAPGLKRNRYSHARFFSDDDGVLQKKQQRRYPRRKREIVGVRAHGLCYYESIKGIWYRFDGLVVRTHVPEFIFRDGYVKPAHIVESLNWDKKQAGKKELKAIRGLLKDRTRIIYKSPN
jgi:hypothetical protein